MREAGAEQSKTERARRTKYAMPLTPITVGSRLTATSPNVDDTI